MRQESPVLGLVLWVLLAAGCDVGAPGPGAAEGSRASPEEAPAARPTPPGSVRLAAIFPTSGRYEASGRESFRGVRIAVEETNAAGGVAGRPLFLVEYPTRSDVESTGGAARRAVAEGALALIGSNSSLLSQAMAEVAEEAGVVMVSNVSTATELTVGRPFVFRTCYSNDELARLLVEFVWTHLGGRRPVVLQEVARLYSKDLGEAFARHFQDRIRSSDDPSAAIRVRHYVTMESDFTPHLDEIRLFRADVIFLPSSFDDATLVAMHMKAMGLEVTLVGGDSWASKKLFNRGDPGRPAYHTDHWSPDPASPFCAAYQARHGMTPECGRAALAYDAVQAVAAALRGLAGAWPEADPVGEGLAAVRRELRDRLATVRTQGASSLIGFDRHGNGQRPCYVFEVYRGNRTLAATLE
ncbi:MAG: ABC transporter substrate-binding protein [Planctomycetes bacterium]|nr:ABC transporter substrate-binding protein [Planctomycetota bacterium]